MSECSKLTARNSLPTLPLQVGESDMDLRGVLRRHARWILRTTPEALGESDGEIQESFPTVARSAGGQCPAQAAGRFVHCAGRAAVRGGDLLGHGRVRPGQRKLAAADP